MKIKVVNILLAVFLVSWIGCKKSGPAELKESPSSRIIGTWKLIYGEIQTKDSIEIKDLSNTTFVKIFNETHFAFFNQRKGTSEGFYGGGGTYKFEGNTHKEILEYSSLKEVRGHEFTFEVEFKGDTLIQKGLEEVPEIGLKHYIIEKYIKLE